MGLIAYFVRHPVAANLLMILMLLTGLFALKQLPIQFFPDFSLPLVRISVDWPGAGAEDIERSITTPLEQALKSVDDWRRMISTSTEERSSILMEFEEGVDILLTLNDVHQKVDEVQHLLPQEADEPEVVNLPNHEPVVKLLVSARTLSELRPLIHRFKDELIDRGVDQVTVVGLPEEEITIELTPETLETLGWTLDDLARRIAAASGDLPLGSVGGGEAEKVARIIEQKRTLLDFAQIPLITREGYRLELGAVAKIGRRPKEREALLRYEERPAVLLKIQRASGGDTFAIAETFYRWLEEVKEQLPTTIELHVYHPVWQYIRDRILLLLKNGATGLILVLAILFLFLNGRVAFWVAMGIPASVMAAVAILDLAGGSIDMVTLFALIMGLGIIVDDAIVVGEHALSCFERGMAPIQAAFEGARRMVAPVMASSLTTIAAFLPLMLVSGPTGKILFAIPLMVIAVITASLIECFFVLPAHLKGAFVSMAQRTRPGWHLRFEEVFGHFRERHFRRLVRAALRHRQTTLALALAFLIVAVGLFIGKRVRFFFFEAPDADLLYATVAFVPGTPPERVRTYLKQLERALHEVERQLSDRPLVRTVIHVEQAGLSSQGLLQARGKHLGGLIVELFPSERRKVSSRQLLLAWRKRIPEAIGLDHVLLTERQAGIPGRDVTVQLRGPSPEVLKQAASELKATMAALPGLFEIVDDLPYGREQWIFRLTPFGEMVGLTPKQLGEILRAYLAGRWVESFQEGPDEITVRLLLEEPLRRRLDLLDHIQIPLPSGERVPLLSVAEAEVQQGFEILRHADGHLAVEVSADVDRSVTNPNLVMDDLFDEVLPKLAERYPIEYREGGKAREQRETLEDMGRGAYLGLALIYLILAWIFSSYGRPLLVMAIIPFGIVGAIFGHALLGLDLTILSLFGIFGLSGIVVNDSIILVSFYRELRAQGMAILEALEEAACQRLRAVILTSATTIAGLLPLLFETSLQAKFLIPMAVSIIFGLLFSTFWVLVLVPALLAYYELGREKVIRFLIWQG